MKKPADIPLPVPVAARTEEGSVRRVLQHVRARVVYQLVLVV